MKKIKFVVAIGLSLVALVATPLQAERSPIFGAASIQAMSVDAARDITARGFWADFYGGLAVTFAYNAYIYGYYARYFAVSNSANEQAWYWAATNNAYYAYLYFFYAASNSAAGQ